MKKATIYDVAREAGVSLATVSRVINGSSVVREKTKEKVMKVIDELNFKPNQIARGLATNKTTTIAIIFPQSLFAHVKDMIGGIGDAGRTLDYNITIYTTDDIGNGPMDDVMEKVIRTRADGVILFNNDNIDQQIELVKKHSIPAVVIGMQVSDESIGSVYVDAQKITYDIVNNYLEKGKNDIIFVSPQQNLIRTVDLIEGMKINNRFQDIVASCMQENKSGNDVLKDSLKIARDEGIEAMLYSHPCNFYGHGPGPTIGLWNNQDKVLIKGDVLMSYDTTYALELNTKAKVFGYDYYFYTEETVAFTKEGLIYLYPGREHIYFIK